MHTRWQLAQVTIIRLVWSYTRTTQTLSTFSALYVCSPTYNNLLKATVDILMSGGHELHVLHVGGEQNEVADAISQADFTKALAIVPTLKLSTFTPCEWTLDSKGKLSFQPPRGTLGVEQL